MMFAAILKGWRYTLLLDDEIAECSKIAESGKEDGGGHPSQEWECRSPRAAPSITFSLVMFGLCLIIFIQGYFLYRGQSVETLLTSSIILA